jgi:ribosomal protein S10
MGWLAVLREVNARVVSCVTSREEAVPPARITVTCVCANFTLLTPVCTDLINRAKDRDLRVKGPVRLPTKVLKHTTRKT